MCYALNVGGMNMTFIKERSSMIATIICGVLMVTGLINQNTGGTLFPYIFIIGMIIGGFNQTKRRYY